MFGFNSNENNTIFEGVLYNDFEIDLLLRMYGTVKKPTINMEQSCISNESGLSYNFNKGD